MSQVARTRVSSGTIVWEKYDQVFYVATGGDDANDGKAIEGPKATFGSALTAASAETPTSTNKFAIVCFDAGIFTENLTCVEYVDIWAPNATLEGSITLEDNVSVKLRSQIVATGTIGIVKTAGTDYAFVEIDDIDVAGTGVGLVSTSGFVNFTWKTLTVVNGFGIGDLSTAIGHMHLKGGDIYVTGTGTAIARANAGYTVGRIDHLLDTGGGNGTAINCVSGDIDLVVNYINDFDTALDINGGTTDIICNEVDSTAAYDVAAGATLNLNVQTLAGTQTNAGTLTLIRNDGESSMNDIVSTGLTDTSRTQHAVSVYGTSGALSEVGPLTDGQLVVGSTGNAPVAATLTAGTDISITNAAGSITINSTGGGGIEWEEVTTTSQSADVDTGYITNNANLVTVTLPSTIALGEVVRVTGKGAGGWRVAQNAGQTVYFGSSSTTTGTGGRLDSTHRRDSVELVCVTANTDFNVLSSVGNITVA